MKVPYVDLGGQWLSIRDRALPKISEVLESGMYLEHPIIEALEERFAKYPESIPEKLVGELGRERIERNLGVTLRKACITPVAAGVEV